MSEDTGQLPATLGDYEKLMSRSKEFFGTSFYIPEFNTRERVEYALGRDSCGGFALTVVPKSEPLRKIGFRQKPYIRECERIHMLKVGGRLYALISLNKGEVWDITDSTPGRPCTHAICVFPPPSDSAAPDFYLLL
jgi:hypothetical protein